MISGAAEQKQHRFTDRGTLVPERAMPTDPLTLVFMALSAVTSALLFVWRQLMVEKDKSYDRMEEQCEQAKTDFKAESAWLREQLAQTQSSQVATLNVISRAVETQGVGVKAILDLLQATADTRRTGSER